MANILRNLLCHLPFEGLSLKPWRLENRHGLGTENG